jgi:glycosyltransferase involved in cell wall biosynthesis
MSARRPVRILQITSYPPPRAGWGVRVEHVRRALERMGHDCQVLNTGRSRKIRSPEYVDVQNGVDYTMKVLRHSLAGYVVHMHINGDSPKGLVLALIAVLVNLATGKRPVLTFHAGPEQRFFPQHRSRLLAPVFRLLFTAPKTIICNSEAVKARIAGYGVPASKIVPIPAFSRQYLEFEPADLDRATDAFLRRSDPVLCTYVFFRPEFFIDSLVDAVRRLSERYPRIGLVVMGSDAGSGPIRERVDRLGLADRILFAGDLPHDAFLTVMTRSKLYVRTPKKDGVASSVLEALSLGVPVVAADNGTRPESVITFEADNADHLAAQVAYALDHYERVKNGLVAPEIRDTVADEAGLLAGGAAADGAPREMDISGCAEPVSDRR